MQTITEYYDNKNNLREIFNSVKRIGWNYLTVEDIGGRIRPCKKRINSIRRLRKFIGEAPSKLYISVGQFLHPQTVFGKHPKKSQWMIDDTLFLKSDLFFDFDGDGIDFSQPHEDGKKIIVFMKNQKDYELRDIFMSGKKGFGLIYEDKNPIIEPHPIKRMQKTQEKRKELISKLPELKTINLHHKRIIADQFRVHAVIGSVKAETGFKVRRLTEEEFMLSSTNHLKGWVCQRVVRPIDSGTPRNRPMMGRHPANTTGLERPTLSSNSSYNFIDNVVKGTKNMYVTVLKYPISIDTTKIIKNIQKVYNLDNFYKFVYKDLQMLINLKLVDKRRLEKIMKYSRCMNLNSFMFYGHTWIPITKAEDSNGNVVWEKPEFKEVIESGYGMNDTHSSPHANLFGLKFENMAGNKMNNILKAMVGEG